MEDASAIREKFGKEFAYLETGVVYAAWIQQFGSFSERNPHLGRMLACPLCRRRIRAAIGCTCTSHYATTQRAWSPDHDVREQAPKSGPGYGPTPRHEKGVYQVELEKPREGELFSKRARREMMRRLRQRPVNQGFRRAKHLHDVVLEMQDGVTQVGEDKSAIRYYRLSSLVVSAAREMHVDSPEERNIPIFAQKYLTWKQKQNKRAHRKARRTRQGA